MIGPRRVARSPGGFTLIELLVVSVLFLAFFSLAAATARPNPAAQVRQLSQELSSAMLVIQSRSMSSDYGAALTIDAPPSLIAGSAISFAQAMPPVSGTVSGWQPQTSTWTAGTGTFFPLNAANADLAACFAARLFTGGTNGPPATPSMMFSHPGTAGGLGTLSLNAATLNQTNQNTVLPAALTPLGFVADRYPAGSDSRVSVPRLAAIDLRYSGVGMATTASLSSTGPDSSFARLSDSGLISLRFDRNGCLDMLIRTNGSPAATAPLGPLYLLIASTADISGTTSLRSRLSRWLVIAPDTGRFTVAANVTGTFTGTPTAIEVNAARSNASQAVTEGAR